MRRIGRLLCLGVILRLLVAAPAVAAQDEGIAVGTPAPAVVIANLKGQTVDLGKVIGKRPVMLEFWATWCTVCTKLMPRVRAAHDKYGREIEFVGINVAVNQTVDRVR